MAAQLTWTLATGPTAIQSVELQVNGRPMQVTHSQYQLPQTYQDWLPTQPAASRLYYIGAGGAVRTLLGVGQPGGGQAGRIGAVPGAAGAIGVPVLTSIAVSPDGRSVAGIAGGTTVYTTGLSRGREVAGVAPARRQLHVAELGFARQSLGRRLRARSGCSRPAERPRSRSRSACRAAAG